MYSLEKNKDRMIVHDQMQREVELSALPQRIISLVPSQTELLYDLGLGHRVVGITKFCVHPQSWFYEKQRIGGTKQVKLERILELKPDLIIGNKEENTRADIETLAEHYPVWMSDISTLADALAMTQKVGRLVGKAEVARHLAQQIKSSFEGLQSLPSKRVAYFIWQKPWMVAARNTFIDAILSYWGLQNCFADKQRYPVVTEADLKAAQPDYIFLSSEPFPFKNKHVEAFRSSFPQATTRLVDGELFSWYGSRLLQTAAYLNELREELL